MRPYNNATHYNHPFKPSSASYNTLPNATEAPVVQRLCTHAEHYNYFHAAIQSAKDSILITSYSIAHFTFNHYNIYQSLANARRQGVRIYIYWNDHKPIDRRVSQFLDEWDIHFDQAYTHSKFLMIDKRKIVIGSFNWLSENLNYQQSANGSLVTEGTYADTLGEDIWQHLMHYRQLQYGHYRQARCFDRDPDNQDSPSYKLAENSYFTYLPTLEEHQNYLFYVIKEAKNKVIVCSPFISQWVEEDILVELLRPVLRRGVNLYFVYNPGTISRTESNQLFNHLGSLARDKHFHLIPIHDFHLKTIIVDDVEIAEGSFNWFSATRDRAHEHHNHEATAIVDGDCAIPLIQHFYDSSVGQELTQTYGVTNQSSSQLSSHAPSASYAFSNS